MGEEEKAGYRRQRAHRPACGAVRIHLEGFMSDTADRGNPHFSANPFAEFLTTFLQVRSCKDTIRRRSAISGQQQMSLSDTLAFETARHVGEEAKSLADRDLQAAVMQAVMACGSTCSAAWNSVGGVRIPQPVELNLTHMGIAFSGLLQSPYADGASLAQAKGLLDAA
jgi:hypothetical protein